MFLGILCNHKVPLLTVVALYLNIKVDLTKHSMWQGMFSTLGAIYQSMDITQHLLFSHAQGKALLPFKTREQEVFPGQSH